MLTETLHIKTRKENGKCTLHLKTEMENVNSLVSKLECKPHLTL
jgi:hypothetical protein